MRRGKHMQHGCGSLRRSMRKAEIAARRSRKLAEKRAAFRYEREAA